MEGLLEVLLLLLQLKQLRVQLWEEYLYIYYTVRSR